MLESRNKYIMNVTVTEGIEYISTLLLTFNKTLKFKNTQLMRYIPDQPGSRPPPSHASQVH